ncbi:hypothetical protein B0A49_04045 [Cryomyces minteri]|uniref:Uncharacterized protein n=2 Tax=Cryomyces minteri TaxID=331657 RepID=A0A4U0WC16_9PEZI|nr:hypothetical protein B0A49_13078 [Cryomyces minteri]TKA74524.1 hypothetical protein B0A49_04045 [Cryomyces minteri]
MSAPQQQAIRRWIITGAVAGVTATGAWYGAGLKTRQEFTQVKRVRAEATTAEKIAQLENARGGLVVKRTALERKIEELRARRNGERPVLGQERR